ncbi:unnamed protein product [Rhodiola kirilowii]
MSRAARCSSSSPIAMCYYLGLALHPRWFGTYANTPQVNTSFISNTKLLIFQKRCASHASHTEDDGKRSIGPRKDAERNEGERRKHEWFIKKVKMLSLSTCCLSVSLGPVITFMTSPDLNVIILKGAVAASVIFNYDWSPSLIQTTATIKLALVARLTPQKEPVHEKFVKRLLDRRWMLPTPETKVHQVKLVVNPKTKNDKRRFGDIRFFNNTNPCLLGGEDAAGDGDGKEKSFYVVRDDLIHPLINGNKARKLDALLPLLEQHGITDVLCNALFVMQLLNGTGVTCAERGLNSHLLLRGEQPEILTGYNLISSIYGNVTYVPRSLYAMRDNMLKKHAEVLAGQYGSLVFLSDLIELSSEAEPLQSLNVVPIKPLMCSEDIHKKLVIVNEGAGDGVALLGVIRLVNHLSGINLFGTKKPMKLVVDAGTGTTALGLALGAICLGWVLMLPWEVTAIMLADSTDGYRKKEKELISDFKQQFGLPATDSVLDKIDGGIVQWVERGYPRKFGNVLEGEVEACQQVAQQTGISVDPVYTLAAWELAMHLSQISNDATEVVMLHTGGTLGMFGLAQRYKSSFNNLKTN